MNDVAFGRTLNTEVHNKVFYASAFIMELNVLSPIAVKWPDSTVSGRFVIASQGTINNVVASAAPQQLTVAQCKAAIKQGSPGWLRQFLQIHQDPVARCVDMDFDLCIAWSRTCYFLTPITDLVYLKHLYQRIKTSGLIMMDFEAVVALGSKGLMSCSCGCFLHRAWCIHAFVYARKVEIIIEYPKTMNPAKVSGNQGRPSAMAIAKLTAFEEGGGQGAGAWIGVAP